MSSREKKVSFMFIFWLSIHVKVHKIVTDYSSYEKQCHRPSGGQSLCFRMNFMLFNSCGIYFRESNVLVTEGV